MRGQHGQRWAVGGQSRGEPGDGLVEETQRRRPVVLASRVDEGGHRQAAAAGDVQKALDLRAYKGFRQFPKYEATFNDNAAAYYGQREKRGAAK